MNLSALTDFCGSLLDYDPVNATYQAELAAFINDAQARLLGDRPWSFLINERNYRVRTDEAWSLTFTNGSTQVTTSAGNPYPVSTNQVLPGSPLELGTMTVTDSAALVDRYTVMNVVSTTALHLDRPFTGASGTYEVTLKQRSIYLPADTAQVQAVLNAEVGYPQLTGFLSKLDRDTYVLNPDELGTPESYLVGEGLHVPSPRDVSGAAVVSVGAGQGVRTVTLYMVNVYAPGWTGFDSYPGFSGGFESGLSRPKVIELADTEDLDITPETIPDGSGFYRRYYFTCTAEGIDAPRRLRSVARGVPTTDTDTVSPAGSTTLAADTSLPTLRSQALSTNAPRYQHNQSGVHQSIQLYPHPSTDQPMAIRRLIAPADLIEDQDTSPVPAAYARVLAYEALAQLAVKTDNPQLAAIFERKQLQMYRGMEQRYLGKPSRRIVKNAGGTVYPARFGPLTFT